MDSNLHSPLPDDCDANATFRKPQSDTANRKYRRRSPNSGSLSSDGGAEGDHNSSPAISKHPAKNSDYRHKIKDDVADYDGDSSRGQYSRRGDSSRHFDRNPSRGSYNNRRHEEDRSHHKLSSRSDRDTYLDEHNKSRDHTRNVDKYPRDKYDCVGHGLKDKETNNQRHKDKDIPSDKTGFGKRHTNTYYDERDKHARHEVHRKSDPKDLDGLKCTKQEKRKYNEWETKKQEDPFVRESGEHYDNKTHIVSKSQESLSRKSKFSSLDKVSEPSDYVKNVNETSPNSKQAHGTVDKVTTEHARASETNFAADANAAKVAAMKAAELVNRNIAGVGTLSTDQKKKLLWGNKKNTAVEESGHRWDASLFPDRERQEKFKKLMGVKGEVNQDGSSSVMQAEKEKELQLDLEKQYTAGLRRRDGRTVGLGL